MDLKYHNSDLIRDLKRRGGGPLTTEAEIMMQQ